MLGRNTKHIPAEHTCLTYVSASDRRKLHGRLARFAKDEWLVLYRESADKVQAYMRERAAKRAGPRKRAQRCLAKRQLRAGHISKGSNLTLSMGMVNVVGNEIVKELFPRNKVELSREEWGALPSSKLNLPPKAWQKILKALDRSTGRLVLLN